MTIRTRRLLAVLGAAALAVPSAAAAAPGHGKHKSESKGKETSKRSGAHGRKAKPVTYVVKGVFDAADGTVSVTGGNSHTRRGGLVGDRVAFDFSRAKVVVADLDGDGEATAADLRSGDRLHIQARLPRRDPGTGPHVARKVIDKTNPRVDAGHSEHGTEDES